jgi:flagellar assembly factor FliW
MKKKTERVKTARFGEVAFAPSDLYTFPNGLVGFGALRRFVLLDLDEAGIFRALQSVDEPGFAMIVIDPLIVRPDYKAKVDESAIATLGLTDLADAVVLATVVVPEDPAKMTANLRGPIVINTKTRTAAQVVLSSGDYDVRTPVADALARTEEELHA